MGLKSVNTVGKQPHGYKKVGSVAYEADHVLADGQRTLVMLKGFSTAAGYVQIHNAAVEPADTSVPYAFQAVAANDNWFALIPTAGLPTEDLDKGIYVCFSTSGPTKTKGGAVCWFEGYLC